MNLDQHIQNLAATAANTEVNKSLDSIVLKAIVKFDSYNTCLTRQECAEYLGVSYNTVGAHISSGKIKMNAAGSIPKIQFIK